MATNVSKASDLDLLIVKYNRAFFETVSINFVFYTMFYKQFRVVIMRIVLPYMGAVDNGNQTCV